MKVRVCPKCGKHNLEIAWSCTDCGEVLSITTLIDADSAQLLSETPKEKVVDNPTPIEIQATEIEAPQTENIHLSNYAAMLKEIRSWGVWSLVLGALHVISSGFLSAPWGILLLIVGIASLYFRTASMFIVYAVTLAWAALSNLVGFKIGWVVFALFQFSLSFRVFQQYRHFQNVESEYISITANDKNAETLSANRAARFFPWIGSLLGCSSIIGLFLLAITSILLGVASRTEDITLPGYFGFIEFLIVNFGVLGFSVALASLLSKYRPKALAIIGLGVSTLTLIIELLAFIFL